MLKEVSPELSICILRLSAIGDTCNIVPTLAQIRAAFPAARITWVIGKTEHSLLGEIPDVDFIIVDKSANKQEKAALRKQLSSNSFDVLLHMHASMRANLFSRWIKATRRIGFDRNRARDFQWLFCNERIAAEPEAHVVDGFLSFASAIGAPVDKPEWHIPIQPAASAFARQAIPPNTLIISPCSSDRRKNFRNWSVDNYVRIADHAIRQYGLNIVLSGGPTEREKEYGNAFCSQLEKMHAQANAEETGIGSTRSRVHNLIGKTTLPQLLAMLERAQLLICPDSGPAHMANAVGTPVIGLFATSNRFRTGPYRYLEMAVDAYPEAVEKFLGKSVSEVRWGQRVRDEAAMDLIQFESVRTQLNKLMTE